MQVKCQGPGCPETFEAKRPSAKYHSERCKKRAQRQPGGVKRGPNRPSGAPQRPRKPQNAPEPPPGGSQASPDDLPPLLADAGALTLATKAELERAGRVDCSAGQAALALAGRIDRSAFSAETGTAVASMVRELRASLAAATADVAPAADPVDELRERREQKRAAG